MVAQITCPTCKNKSIWSEANAARPFCSQRCKDIDLGAWASDAYVVEGASPSTIEALEAIEQAIEQTINKQLG